MDTLAILFLVALGIWGVYSVVRLYARKAYKSALWNGYRAGYVSIDDIDSIDYLQDWIESHMVRSAALNTLSRGLDAMGASGMGLAGVIRLEEVKNGKSRSVTAEELVGLYQASAAGQSAIEREMRHYYRRTGDARMLEEAAQTGEYRKHLVDELGGILGLHR